MTTIAYDGRYLAADTLGVRGGNRSEQPSCKIAVQDGYAFAFGGFWGHFRQQLMAWALAAFRDADAPDAPEWRGCPAKDVEGAMLVVTPTRGLLVFTDQAPYPDPEAWPFAVGTGGDIALGAMGAGVTAMEAVKLAMRWDLKTGGEVDFIDVEWLDKGVQRWDGTMPSARFPMSVNTPLTNDYELKRGLLPAAHGHRNGVIGRAEMCDHGIVRDTTFTFDASVDLTDWKDDGTTGTMEFETVEIPKPKVRAGAFVCRGSYVFGTACQQCERCLVEWQGMQKRGQDDDFAVVLLPKGFKVAGNGKTARRVPDDCGFTFSSDKPGCGVCNVCRTVAGKPRFETMLLDDPEEPDPNPERSRRIVAELFHKAPMTQQTCIHGMKPYTCSTCRANRTANPYPV